MVQPFHLHRNVTAVAGIEPTTFGSCWASCWGRVPCWKINFPRLALGNQHLQDFFTPITNGTCWGMVEVCKPGKKFLIFGCCGSWPWTSEECGHRCCKPHIGIKCGVSSTNRVGCHVGHPRCLQKLMRESSGRHHVDSFTSTASWHGLWGTFYRNFNSEAVRAVYKTVLVDQKHCLAMMSPSIAMATRSSAHRP